MRYANITSIPSSYIVAFFSSLGDASPPGEDPPPNKTAKLQFMDSNLHKKITSASLHLQKLFFYALYALLSRCLASYCSR